MGNLKKRKSAARLNTEQAADNLDSITKKIAKNQNEFDSQNWSQGQVTSLLDKDGKVGSIPVNMIDVSTNVRGKIDTDSDDFTALKASIEEHGLLQNPVVSVVKDDEGYFKIVLVSGGRRLAACSSIGLTHVNCMVKIFSEDSKRITAGIAENVNRKEMDVLPLASMYDDLVSKRGYSKLHLSKLFGISRNNLTSMCLIANWSDNVKDLYLKNKERFPTSILKKKVANKFREEEELLDIFSKIKKNSDKKLTKRAPLQKRLFEHFEKEGYKIEEQKIILKAMCEMDLMKLTTEMQETYSIL